MLIFEMPDRERGDTHLPDHLRKLGCLGDMAQDGLAVLCLTHGMRVPLRPLAVGEADRVVGELPEAEEDGESGEDDGESNIVHEPGYHQTRSPVGPGEVSDDLLPELVRQLDANPGLLLCRHALDVDSGIQLPQTPAVHTSDRQSPESAHE